LVRHAGEDSARREAAIMPAALQASAVVAEMRNMDSPGGVGV